MPFENPQAAPAPTRRSSRYRTAAVEAPAAGATATVSEETSAPLSRRAARERLIAAETVIAAAAVAAETLTPGEVALVEEPADSAPDGIEPAEPIELIAVPEAQASQEVEPVTEAELVAETQPVAEAERATETQPSAESEPVAEFEPVAEAQPVVESEPIEHEPVDAGASDAFEAASRVFAFSADDAETSSPTAGAQPDAEPAPEAAESAPAEHVARRRPSARKFVALGATVGVMSLAGLLAVSMTLPAEAVAAVQGPTSALSVTSLVAASDSPAAADGGDEIQAFVTSAGAEGESLARAEDFSTVSLVDLASEQGIKYSNSVFTNDPDAAIQWPFLVGVGMSSGYGPRWGRMHEGVDFVPGEGAPIQAIADGTVRIATEQGGGYGVTVYIDHVIDGQVITSHYSHMQYGSLRVTAGQTVKVGDVVGLTGNTGHSFGAHLHFELIVNGSTIDPLPWLKANAGRYSLD
ncbi:M23 family metallopeptidase [Streptomyces sp. AC495_CC817]|uniref:M23 family metallopeptidase n=1 Tax=Streptomyces sp. AC495_CC817 TaxID=2823900 RepID=UPI001C26A466|nr:M23 family metallopeptidase [Streptomyces sp. AC495_CC817]